MHSLALTGVLLANKSCIASRTAPTYVSELLSYCSPCSPVMLAVTALEPARAHRETMAAVTWAGLRPLPAHARWPQCA